MYLRIRAEWFGSLVGVVIVLLPETLGTACYFGMRLWGWNQVDAMLGVNLMMLPIMAYGASIFLRAAFSYDAASSVLMVSPLALALTLFIGSSMYLLHLFPDSTGSILFWSIASVLAGLIGVAACCHHLGSQEDTDPVHWTMGALLVVTAGLLPITLPIIPLWVLGLVVAMQAGLAASSAYSLKKGSSARRYAR